MTHSALIPWLDANIWIGGVFGPAALLIVCGIIFSETGLLVGFLLPGDTLLFFTGILTVSDKFGVNIVWVCLAISLAAFLGGEVGYLIGHKLGPRVFERKESGLFSMENVRRTNGFFDRFGPLAVIIARFVPIVRTFTPVAAGVGHMSYKKYSLYNLVGALLWGGGLTLAGFVLGQIPPVRDFAESYLDLVLLAAVVVTLVPTVWHYIRAKRKTSAARGAAARTDRKNVDRKPSNT